MGRMIGLEKRELNREKSPQEDMALWHKAISGVTPLKNQIYRYRLKRSLKDLVPNLSRSKTFLKSIALSRNHLQLFCRMEH